MSANTSDSHRVAVCVCTYNRPEGLARMLESLAAIDLGTYDPGDVEVIVVDNCPQDRTRSICEHAAKRLPIPVHYTEEPVQGITYARNRAVEVALQRGADFVAFIDDDDHPQPDWLRHLLEKQSETGADLVFGTWVLDALMPEWARNSGIFRSPDEPKPVKPGSRYGLPKSASTCNVLVSRRALERVAASGDVFDHNFRFSGGEDKDFFIRAGELGASMASADLSVIYRDHEPGRYTARGLLHRGFKNGCSKTRMARVHGSRKKSLKLVASSLAKLVISLIVMPFSVFSRSFLMHNLYRLGKAFGVLYTTATGRTIDYYSR